MKLSSPVFQEGGSIPRKYSCQGEDINPPLDIDNVPKEAVTLALIVDDPDVPDWVRADKMWVHWVVFNVDPKTRHIKEQESTIGTLGNNTDGECRYMGPCPPDKRHRYFFKLYALDCKLSLSKGATKEELEKAMSGHIIDQAVLMGTYEKN